MIGAISVGYWALWGGTTRAMGDSDSYRITADTLASGWGTLTPRSPGYPALLWITGAVDGESALLFLVQLGLHAGAVLLVVDLAGRLPVRPSLMWGLGLLLMAPPVVMKAAYSGSEALAEFLVVATAWLVLRWWRTLSTSSLVAAGVTAGALGLVRPTYQLLVIPLAGLVWVAARRRAVDPAPVVAALALPAVVLVLGVVAHNGARFDSYALTPSLGWHLGAKTSLFVEDLSVEEPARAALVDTRNRLLLDEPGRAAATYAWDARPAVSEATGLDGVALDHYMRDLQVGLILRNPTAYGESVAAASWRYVQFDDQPAGFGGVTGLGRLLAVAHTAMLIAGVALVASVPALLARGRLRGPERAMLVVVGVIVVYSGVVSVAAETGSARLRSPTDPLIALALVILLRAWTRPSVPEARIP